ncbi:MAG: recombinase family protein [Rhodococcus sp. (in: high G+C Gram-positive bacteria)]|uniref:recombinase family protein n=1 Tax=Rhodococcus sp. TaxID=1831 RepID=UPI003BAEDC28
MSNLLGYARTSTADQTPQLQLDALRAAGCFRVWEEVASGARRDRPELAAVLDQLRPGDTLVVWKLDRLGRSLQHLLETVSLIESKGAGFRSLTEQIDTTTPTGRLIFNVFASIAEFERDLIKERSAAGREAARALGRVGGRPAKLTNRHIAQVRRLKREGQAVQDLAADYKVSPSTIYRVIR